MQHAQVKFVSKDVRMWIYTEVRANPKQVVVRREQILRTQHPSINNVILILNVVIYAFFCPAVFAFPRNFLRRFFFSLRCLREPVGLS